MIKEQAIEKDDIEYGYQVMYDEANSRLQEQYESIKTLRGISIALFGFSSLLISLSNPINLIDPLYPNITCQNLLVIGALIFYLLLIIFCLFVIYPAEMKGPVSPSLEELVKAFGNKTKTEVLKQRVSNCLNAIKLNEKALSESSAKSCTLTTKHKIESRFWPEPTRQSTPKIMQKRLLFRYG